MRPFLIFILLVGVLLPFVAAANGGFLPEKGQLRLPSVPEQTALIVHDGKTEVLVVESAFDADQSGTYAWILPVPDVSTMSAVTPGTLETLRFIVGPEVRNRTHVRILPVVYFLALTLCVSGYLTTRHRRYFEGMIALIILGVMMAISVGVSGAASESRGGVIQAVRVGNYEVNVISAKNAAAFNQVLVGEGFEPLGAEQLEVAERYINKQWVFLAATLIADESGILKPHPIKVTFPSTEPVFPMMMTGLNGNPATLNLYTAAPVPLEHPSLRTEFRGTIQKSQSGGDQVVRVGENSRISISHKSLTALLPDGYWLCHLRGEFESKAMLAEDLVLRHGVSVPSRRVYYTPDGARDAIVQAALICLSLMLPIAMVVGKSHPKAGKFFAYCALGVTAVVCLVRLQTINIRDDYYFIPAHQIRASRSARGVPKELKDAASIREWMRTNATNRFTGEPIREIDSPGNYTIEPDEEGKPVVVVYDADGGRF